jgi:hypothetical protein
MRRVLTLCGLLVLASACSQAWAQAEGATSGNGSTVNGTLTVNQAGATGAICIASPGQTTVCMNNTGGFLDVASPTGSGLQLQGQGQLTSVSSAIRMAGGADGQSTGSLSNWVNISASNSVSATTNVVVSSGGTQVTIQSGSITTGSGSSFGQAHVFMAPTNIAAATNYGAFTITTGTNMGGLKFGQVSCDLETTASVGTSATLAIVDTSNANAVVCSGSFAATALNTPTAVFNCNTAPPAVNHIFALRFTTGWGTTQGGGIDCTIDMTH